jgi:hypothetical protein
MFGVRTLKWSQSTRQQWLKLITKSNKLRADNGATIDLKGRIESVYSGLLSKTCKIMLSEKAIFTIRGPLHINTAILKLDQIRQFLFLFEICPISGPAFYSFLRKWWFAKEQKLRTRICFKWSWIIWWKSQSFPKAFYKNMNTVFSLSSRSTNVAKPDLSTRKQISQLLHTHTLYIYIYIYIYVCVRVCMCMYICWAWPCWGYG